MKTQQELAEELMLAVQESTLDAVRKGVYLRPYTTRVGVPEDLVKEIYAAIDYEWVLANLKPRINKLVADRIFSYIRQTVVEDVSAVLRDDGARDRLKATLLKEFRPKPHLMPSTVEEAKPVVFTQEMFPVSIETKCAGNHYPPNQSEIILKGLVKVDSPFIARSELLLEMDATSSFALQVRAAVCSRKKYKLTLEETEETF